MVDRCKSDNSEIYDHRPRLPDSNMLTKSIKSGIWVELGWARGASCLQKCEFILSETVPSVVYLGISSRHDSNKYNPKQIQIVNVNSFNNCRVPVVLRIPMCYPQNTIFWIKIECHASSVQLESHYKIWKFERDIGTRGLDIENNLRNKVIHYCDGEMLKHIKSAL
jgi:hypothetical protein